MVLLYSCFSHFLYSNVCIDGLSIFVNYDVSKFFITIDIADPNDVNMYNILEWFGMVWNGKHNYIAKQFTKFTFWQRKQKNGPI